MSSFSLLLREADQAMVGGGTAHNDGMVRIGIDRPGGMVHYSQTVSSDLDLRARTSSGIVTVATTAGQVQVETRYSPQVMFARPVGASKWFTGPPLPLPLLQDQLEFGPVETQRGVIRHNEETTLHTAPARIVAAALTDVTDLWAQWGLPEFVEGSAYVWVDGLGRMREFLIETPQDGSVPYDVAAGWRNSRIGQPVNVTLPEAADAIGAVNAFDSAVSNAFAALTRIDPGLNAGLTG